MAPASGAHGGRGSRLLADGTIIGVRRSADRAAQFGAGRGASLRLRTPRHACGRAEASAGVLYVVDSGQLARREWKRARARWVSHFTAEPAGVE